MRTPMGKLGEPTDFAATVLFLTSALHVTAVVPPVDGTNPIGF